MIEEIGTVSSQNSADFSENKDGNYYNMYTLSGEITHGAGRGKKVGMPTANLKICDDTILPPLGVYSSIVTLGKLQYLGVTNIGVRPSVCNDNIISVETFILDFSKNIYGQNIEISLYKRLRSERKFNSLQEVKKQVLEDCSRTRSYLQSLIKDQIEL